MDREPRDNPYAPPATGPTRTARGAGWRRWGGTLSRAGLVVLGFALLADPSSVPVLGALADAAAGGRSVARGVGLVALVLAFVPWRLGAAPDPDRIAEEL